MKINFENENNDTRILVCGGRHFNEYHYLELALNNIIENYNLDIENIEIVSGHCEGTDALAETYAKNNDIKLKIFPANWKTYGRSAGPIRNSKMIEYLSESNLPIVVAFISENSKGTRDTVNKAKKKGFEVITYNYDIEDVSLSLYEGITYNEDSKEFEFDFENDTKEDIVKLTKTHINNTVLFGKQNWYGYRINNKNSIHKNDFLHYYKSKDGIVNPNVQEMINLCVEEFLTNNPIKYDCIIPMASSSDLNMILAKKLSEDLNAQIIELEKLSTDKIYIDYDKVLKGVHGDKSYADKFYNNICKKTKDCFIPDNVFSISNVPSKYRQFLSPIFKIKNSGTKNIDFNKYKNILLIDDTRTTGVTLKIAIELLQNLGYLGNIGIFTFMKN